MSAPMQCHICRLLNYKNNRLISLYWAKHQQFNFSGTRGKRDLYFQGKNRTIYKKTGRKLQKRISYLETLFGFHRSFQSISKVKNRTVLGIETSCDDTGAAVVDENGKVLGESLNSQTNIHVELGGIIPPVARDLHKKNIDEVVNTALEQASLTINDVDAIAVTVKPGLAMSLLVGLHYAKELVTKSGVDFPFIVLLISGGHCLLALVKDVDDFYLLGKSLDDAPGDAFDKIARQLRLNNLPECNGMSGGQAIEHMAKKGDPTANRVIPALSQSPNCNFSFAGIKSAMKRLINREEEKHGIQIPDVLPNAADICANFQYSVLKHLAKRVQRAFLFCEQKEFMPFENKTLVVSGGVASNMFIRQGLQKVCDHYGNRLVCPPPKLCTDNGIMIAWNGIEKLKQGIGVETDIESLDIQTKCPLGVDLTEEVEKACIRTARLKLL